ncbi:MAG TPA: hypothetical protein VMD53_11665 [Rhizomicrobium sp.]|nr:hypothetical protein [Rhizomicrobium sp.]
MNGKKLAWLRRKRLAPFRVHSVFALWIALVFAASGYAVQTHIHLDHKNSAGTHLPCKARRIDLNDHCADGGQGPADGSDKCPLCQAAMSIGHFVVPVPASQYFPSDRSVSPEVVPSSASFVFALNRAWQSRAPPRI